MTDIAHVKMIATYVKKKNKQTNKQNKTKQTNKTKRTKLLITTGWVTHSMQKILLIPTK